LNTSHGQIPQTTNWWWVRHAPTGMAGRMIGATDVPAILPDGKVIEEIANMLPDGATWMVSPRLRCRQTAEALMSCSLVDIEPVVMPAFSEQDFGDWEQLSYDRPEVRDAADFWRDPGNSTPPGGESFAALTKRVQTGIQELEQQIQTGSARDIVIVAHAGVIRAAVALALDLDPDQALRLQLDPLSLTRIKSFRTNGNAAAHPDNLATNFWSLQGLNLMAGQYGNQTP
jgi:alpha-ribazole phosphatase